MTASEARQSAGELLDSFIGAPAGRIEAAFADLAGALWKDGRATDLAPAAVRDLVPLMDWVDDQRKGHLAILLGLLAETEYPATDGPLSSHIRTGMDCYLEAWRGAEKGGPLSLALQYLLSHFPHERSRILDVAGELRLDVDDMSRLDRALQRFDPEHPVIGRAFPYPGAWHMDDAEQEFDRAWISSQTPEQLEENWHKDSRIVIGYAGAKAYWAVRHGRPTPPVPDSIGPRHPQPTDADPAIFSRHAEAFQCPSCGGRLSFRKEAAQCIACSATFPITKGILDLMSNGGDTDRGEDFLFQLAQMGSMGYYAEAFARPNFKRLCGFTWDGPVTAEYEEKHIIEHVRPVDGPVLDIAAGAGGWTKALVKGVGAERVIAVDIVPAMVATLRHRLPQVPAVLASGDKLPFGDETIGGAMCWNGPHAFLDHTPGMIAEVGRCLRPGGTLTLYTFRNSEDPIYRYFVASHHFPQHQSGLRLFELDDLKDWLARAGLRVRHEQLSPGLAVFITAEKTH